MYAETGVKTVLGYLAQHPYLVAAISLLPVTLLFLSSRRKKGRNPLQTDHRRAPEPFVHDTKLRDAVLKERFKSSKVPEKLDAIIIGSGVGGLSAGVLLARAGKKVLVLEQHDQAGGCCHSFIEKGFEFDTGIHYIGDMQDSSHYRVLLDQLTCGQLRWTKMTDAFDTVALGKSSSAKMLPMKSGKREYYENLINLYPKEKAAILEFKKLVKNASDSFFGYAMLKVLPRFLVKILLTTGLYGVLLKFYRQNHASKTLQEVLDGLTTNRELKVVLSYVYGDYGVLPKDVPFVLHAVLVKHYADGAWFPENGTSEIAFHMIQAIKKGGGSVLVQAPVTKILCDSEGTAIGVQVGKEKVAIYAKYIISDAGVVNTFRKLLPEEVARKSEIYPLIEKVGQSGSFITAFFGMEGSSSELKLPSGNIWLYETDDINNKMTEFLNMKADDLETAEIPFAFLSFPSAKDPQWDKKFPGKSSALAITYAKWEWFEEWKDEKLRHRGDRYEDLKNLIGTKLWQKFVDLYPQVDGTKVYMEVGTPVTNQYYLACPRGEMYGLDQGVPRFSAEAASKLRPDTDIKGLYLTGQDIMTCGFVAALIVGVMCTSTILNRNVLFDLEKLKKEILKKNSLGKTSYQKKQE